MNRGGANAGGSEGADAVAEPVSGDFDVFAADTGPHGEGRPVASVEGEMGGAGIEGEAGSVMAERVEGAAGMVPGGDEDDFLGVAGAEEGEGELGVLAGGLGLVFELDGGFGDAAGEEDAFVIEGIAGAGDEDAWGGAVVEELGGAFDAFGGAAAEQDDDVGAGGGVIDAEELPGEGAEGGEQGDEDGEDGEGESVSGFELHGPPFFTQLPKPHYKQNVLEPGRPTSQSPASSDGGGVRRPSIHS